MRLNMLKLLFLSVLLCFVPPVLSEQASNKQQISWQTYHRPPASFREGELIGKGFVDLSLQMVVDALPEYEHQRPATTLARALENIRQGRQVCHPALYPTQERKQFAVFSQSSLITPSIRVVAREDFAKQVLSSPVDLPALINNPQYSFILVTGRSYGKAIDELLARYKNVQQVSIAAHNVANLFRLVEKGRVDFTLAYPFEFAYYKANESDSVVPLSLYTIQNAAPYVSGAIACPNNAWGRQVIKRIDQILTTLKKDPAYIKAMTTWWRSDAQTPAFTRYYQDEFLQQGQE